MYSSLKVILALFGLLLACEASDITTEAETDIDSDSSYDDSGSNLGSNFDENDSDADLDNFNEMDRNGNSICAFDRVAPGPETKVEYIRGIPTLTPPNTSSKLYFVRHWRELVIPGRAVFTVEAKITVLGKSETFGDLNFLGFQFTYDEGNGYKRYCLGGRGIELQYNAIKKKFSFYQMMRLGGSTGTAHIKLKYPFSRFSSLEINDSLNVRLSRRSPTSKMIVHTWRNSDKPKKSRQMYDYATFPIFYNPRGSEDKNPIGSNGFEIYTNFLKISVDHIHSNVMTRTAPETPVDNRGTDKYLPPK